MATNLPSVLPGHWETAEGLQKAKEYATKARGDLALSEHTDLGLANALYLVQGEIAIQTAAKERMRWLSVQLALANGVNADLLSCLKRVLADIADYERVNNLAPNPGRAECWSSVDAARAALAKAEGRAQ